ncbi:MAG: hypothetical protein COB35_10125 [Gammaproteobacteria bacterium]|nr:MAG: hypothetical protein COB35_10125 [Gammaproteobacteria bacterium]
MNDKSPRYIKIDDWYFEIKMVRALKVDKYGEPYSAIANCNINGDAMYIDGLLTKKEEDFTKQDFMTFYKFSQRLGVSEFSYQRYQDGKSVHKTVKTPKITNINDESSQESVFVTESLIRLVK